MIQMQGYCRDCERWDEVKAVTASAEVVSRQCRLAVGIKGAPDRRFFEFPWPNTPESYGPCGMWVEKEQRSQETSGGGGQPGTEPASGVNQATEPEAIDTPAETPPASTAPKDDLPW